MNPALVIACVLLYSKFAMCAVIDHEADSSDLDFEPVDGNDAKTEPMPVDENREKNYTHMFHTGWRTAMEQSAIKSAPFVKHASRTSAYSQMLPMYFAEKGERLGSMVAVPLEALSVLSSGLYSGVTAYIVSVPIAVRSGMEVAADQIKRMKTRQPRGVKMFMKKAFKKGLKPIAILVGKDVAINGIKLKLIGKGLKFVGLKKFGAKTYDFGNEVLNGGNSMFKWGTGGWKFPFADKESDGGISLLRFVPAPVLTSLMRLNLDDENEPFESTQMMANSTSHLHNSTSSNFTEPFEPIHLNVTKNNTEAHLLHLPVHESLNITETSSLPTEATSEESVNNEESL